MLILALGKTYPNITPETVAAELRKICGYKGVQGEFCYDENGEGIKKVQVGIHKSGKMMPYTGK